MNNKKTFWAVAGLLALSAPSVAQVSNYTFSQESSNYTPLSSPTVLAMTTANNGTGSLDQYLSTQNLPFTFKFNGTDYNAVNIYADGYVTFGTWTKLGAHYKPITASSDLHEGVIAAINDDLVGLNIPGTQGEISYEILGTAPNREFVVQWKNFTRYDWRGYTSNRYEMEFQIRLQENGTIKKVFNVGAVGTPSSRYFTSGLRGSSPDDFAVRTNDSATNGDPNADNWTTTQAGTRNSQTIYTDARALPPRGYTFTWTPPAPTNTCAAVSNFNFSFENMTEAELFSTHCWKGSYTTFPTVSVTNTAGSNGNIPLPDKALQIYKGMSASSDIILVTPEISTTSGTHSLSFDIEIALSGTPSAITGTENIEVGTLANPNDFTSFTSTGTTFAVNTTGTFKTGAITFPTGHKHVALKFNLGNPHKALVIDNVKWEQNTMSTSEIAKDSSDITVYPNPASDWIKIQSKDKVNSVSIFNSAGALVLQSEQDTLNINHLPKGAYFLKVSFANGKESAKKFVKN